VTDIYGKPLEFNHGYQLEANKGVVVTNGQLHDAVLEALALAGVVS
jgi:3'(2'), 5'-bisphosphate nucleotidase